jgi:putative acetyltransferase
MPEHVVSVDGFVLRRTSVVEAQVHGDRLRAIFRDAVVAAGTPLYSPDQVTAWSASADSADRWAPRLAEGTTWIATTRDAPDIPIGFSVRRPADYLDLLYVDPAFHRRGLGGALLGVAADEARDEGIASLTADASLISYPVFVAAGYNLVAWEEVEHRGLTFRRAKMRKNLGIP